MFWRSLCFVKVNSLKVETTRGRLATPASDLGPPSDSGQQPGKRLFQRYLGSWSAILIAHHPALWETEPSYITGCCSYLAAP